MYMSFYSSELNAINAVGFVIVFIIPAWPSVLVVTVTSKAAEVVSKLLADIPEAVSLPAPLKIPKLLALLLLNVGAVRSVTGIPKNTRQTVVAT
jgi:hypothetical protein